MSNAFRPYYGPLKTITCTLVTPTWTDINTEIPSSESSKWGRTLTSSDIPTWSIQPASVKYVENFAVNIRNTSGSTQTINYELFKNDISLGSSSATLATNNYRTFMGCFYDVVSGDKLELALWCSSPTNVIVNGSIAVVVPTRFLPSYKPCKKVSYSTNQPSVPSGVTGSNSTGSIYLGTDISGTLLESSFDLIEFTSSPYYMTRYYYGDYNSNNGVTLSSSSTTSKYFQRSSYISSISFRELNI